MKIYLGSKSPRRKELLSHMQIDFEVLEVDTPEISLPDETPDQYSTRRTKEKLDAAWEKITQEKLPLLPVLCADTEVVLDGVILGKPQSYQDALQMLKSISGSSHQVLTSVGIRYLNYEKILMNTTTVTFAPMSDTDIHTYLALEDYKDKAGSYGIQSYIGQFICHIEGCFYSVMGLPLNSVRALLMDLENEKTRA